ncbi:MAG: T3SS effector HopA1 family protein [Nostocaceae cyanobacterium]|nr:T3SS effector HopA1 family protein [Nostocaceae cyanobacterium]
MMIQSLSPRISDDFPQNLLASLQDIANQVEIESNFAIHHPDYKPLDVSPETFQRLQQLPVNIQNNFLSSLLRSFIYGIYYNGSLRKALAANGTVTDSKLIQNLENNTLMGVDVGFYEGLHSSNNGEGFFDPGWQILREKDDGSLAVKKSDLTLYIERKLHLQTSQANAKVGDTVAIRMPKNLVQNGYYMAVGNAGRHNANNNQDGKLVRVYFNLNPQGAIGVMSSLTQQLNAISIPFCFKVLYNPSDYKRFDSGVLYFEKGNYTQLRLVLQSVYREHQSNFGTEVPLFTKLLSPGLSLAEEPDYQFMTEESFGLNRCHIVASGYLAAWRQGNQSPQGRLTSILKQFELLGIEWQRPYLNPKSEDIYLPLNE